MKRIIIFSALLALPFMSMQAAVDPDFYIYLCFGQSNMEGNAQPEAQDYQDIDPRFQMLACVDFTNPQRTMGQWYLPTPPIVRQGMGLGMADYFGRTMVKNLPENVRVGVVDVAIGGTKIEGFMPDQVAGYIASMNPQSEGWLINFFKAYDNNPYKRLVDMAKIAQQSGVIKGILLHQGESNNTQSDWPQKVKSVYDHLISDLNLNAADVPLFVGETVRTEQGGYCGGHNSVIANVPNVIPNSYVISSADCPQRGDGLHFTAKGYRVMGQRYAQKALSLMGIEAEIDDPNTPTGNQEKSEVSMIDYSIMPMYTYYRLEPPAGVSFDLKDGALTIENNKVQAEMYSVQPIILDQFNLEAGADYLVSIDMETSDAGNYWLCLGTWNNSMPNYGLSFDVGRQTKEISFNNCTVSTSNNDAHLLFQCGKFMGTVKIYKVTLYRLTAAGIQTISSCHPQNDNLFYDLQGRSFAKGRKPAVKGLYIVNGRKVFIR